jgi:para-aminobenzoate synthetase/4-amino-4-deoxychorismate lyase
MEIVRERLEGDGDPLVVARWLRGEDRPVALSGRWLDGGTVLTSHPARVAIASEDPFELFAELPAASAPGADADAGAIGGGWFGWLGYGLGRSIERLPPAPPRPNPLPMFDLAYHDHVVRCNADREWWFEALWTEERAEALRQRLAIWRTRIAATPPGPKRIAAGPLVPTGGGKAAHRAAVAETINRIMHGDLSQANICMRLEGPIHGDPLDLWIAAVATAPPGYAAFVGGAGHAILSLSPELFLRRQGRDVRTDPIKGTAPRTSDPAALAQSEKDRAENVMIVDLMRNDLGRVCEYGSVVVERLCEVEPAAGVWHLVSSVSGRLRRGVGDAELLRATFPPGSVTGAPKIRAMQLIHELEATAREAYCGAIGLCSPISGLELNVAIRTLETRHGRLWLGAGGGIVSDSEPESEVEEAMAKARGVAGLAGIEIRDLRPRRAAVVGPLRHRRPNPEFGVIETIRVSRGEPLWLSAHVARMRASCDELGIALGEDLAECVAEAAFELGEGGLRVSADRGGSRISERELPAPGAVRLTPTVLPGGLGAHKWADRRLITELSALGSMPLLLDLDGTVLEAGHAAVVLVVGEALLVPPIDGRMLPSISRTQLLADAVRAGHEVRTEAFTLADIRAGDGLILSSSLRGPHVGLLDGTRPDGATAALCERLTVAVVR